MTQKMLHVALDVAEGDAPRAAYLLARYGIFSPEHSLLGHYNPLLGGGQRYHDAVMTARGRLAHLRAHFGQLPAAPDADPTPAPPTLEELRDINAWLDELVHVTAQCQASREHFHREQHREAALRADLEPLRRLGVDLDLLARPKRFIQTWVGTLPQARLAELKADLAAVGAWLDVFGERERRVYAVAISPQPHALVTRGVLERLGWQDLDLPEALAGPPGQVEAELTHLCERIARRLEALETRHAETYAGISERLARAVRAVELAEPYARLVGETHPLPSGRLSIRGWIPRRNQARLADQLKANLRESYELDLRQPAAAERQAVPSALRRYPTWLGPFADLVRGYGVPCYGDFDPTLFFTLSFTLMFGMMFGDIGHGVLIVLAALFLRGDRTRFRPLLLATGAASCGFGWLYGSVFGLEDVIAPLWLSPLSDPVRMLQAALGWGVGFLLVAQLISLRNRLVAHQWRAALMEPGGLAGLMLYLGGVAALYLAYAGRPGHLAAAGVALTGFTLVFAHHCAQQTGRWPGRLLLSLMASLETLLADFTHTLSFLRLAAFSISHVALALAIVTLSRELGGAGQALMLVLGNVLILVLEGSIVAIQVLRLEYFEGFSRYFTCFGQEFKPIINRRRASGAGG